MEYIQFDSIPKIKLPEKVLETYFSDTPSQETLTEFKLWTEHLTCNTRIMIEAILQGNIKHNREGLNRFAIYQHFLKNLKWKSINILKAFYEIKKALRQLN